MSQDPRTNAPVSDSRWTSGEDVVAHGAGDEGAAPFRAAEPFKAATPDDGETEAHGRTLGGWSTDDADAAPFKEPER